MSKKKKKSKDSPTVETEAVETPADIHAESAPDAPSAPLVAIDLFDMLGDKTRLGIIRSLRGGVKPVKDIIAECGAAQATISHHLSLLRIHRIVAGQRDGKQIHYDFTSNVTRELGSLTFHCENGIEVTVNGI